MALAILGLICIGLVGLGAFLSLRQANQIQDEIAVATPVFEAPTITPTPTFTPIPPTPTDTPEPTPTATLVVGPTAQEASVPDTSLQAPTEEPTTNPNVTPTDTATVDPNVTPTNTLVLQTPQAGTSTPAPVAGNPPAQIPQGGGVLPATQASLLIWAGIGLLLLLIFGLINYLRSASSISENK
ncbi:MAG: hypothetical protein HYR94_13755 [Chloroflexi bacterium]|nr:hypothetical protein [Chloroflexota bacterium]